jgi:hypothetical protein
LVPGTFTSTRSDRHVEIAQRQINLFVRLARVRPDGVHADQGEHMISPRDGAAASARCRIQRQNQRPVGWRDRLLFDCA